MEPTYYYLFTGDDMKNLETNGKELKASKLTKFMRNGNLPEPVKLEHAKSWFVKDFGE